MASQGSINKDIHIHMTNSTDSEDIKTSSSSSSDKIGDYVIFQNKLLTSRIDEVTKENYVLKTTADELEKDVDRLTTALKYLKGVVKNLNEINLLEKEMHSLRMTPFEQLQRVLFAFSSLIGFINDITIGFLFYLSFSYLYDGLVFGSISYTVIIAVLLVLRNVIRKYHLFDFFNPDEAYVNKKTKLNELYFSQNFLSEYVDSL